MGTFVHPALLWGLGLLAVPVLIHLINLWRHRRVEWAAMEFLLESQRKNRRWIVLRQLLLLLARMAAVALLVLVLAQPLLGSRFGALVGAARTHHLVLLDDSFSMSDRWAETSAWQRAIQTVERIVEKASADGGGQSLTLLRFSRAGRQGQPAAPDLSRRSVDTGLTESLKAQIKAWPTSHTDAGPQAPLAAAVALAGDEHGQNVVLYLISDFRSNQWRDAGALRQALIDWNHRGAQVHLVQCVDRAHENLGITALEPKRGLIAAGVPFFLDVTVQNFGHQIAREVSVGLEEDNHARPAVVIDAIAPGASETRQFLVNFPTTGQHTVTARLETDSVAVDNERAAVIDVPVGVPVLVVDSDPQAADARPLALALSPGGTTRTGIDVVLETPRYLVDHPLDRFRTIFLANVAELPQGAVATLEEFVRHGGGLAIFPGESTDWRRADEQLFRDGQGLLPLAFTSPTHLFVNQTTDGPDLETTAHPIFKVFEGQRNSFLSAVRVERYFSTPKQAEATAGPTVRVIARLRNGAPFAAERKFGAGRVVAFFSTAAATWNNWAKNPSFVVAMLELETYLSAGEEPPPPHRVGTPWTIALVAARFQPHVSFVAPGRAEPIEVVAKPSASAGEIEGELVDTWRQGVYEARLTPLDGRTESRHLAVSVTPEEGNLDTEDSQRLAKSLQGAAFAYHRADELTWSSHDLAGFHLSDSLLYALLVLLIGEQVLAYVASYHPPAAEGRH